MKGAFKERPMSRAAEPVHQEDKKSTRQKNAHACRLSQGRGKNIVVGFRHSCLRIGG